MGVTTVLLLVVVVVVLFEAMVLLLAGALGGGSTTVCGSTSPVPLYSAILYDRNIDMLNAISWLYILWCVPFVPEY